MGEYHWRSLPFVDAPTHEDRKACVKYAFSDDITGGNSLNFRNTPIFMAWAHIAGLLPPINLISELETADLTPTLTTLSDSTACFQGIERPHLKENGGESVLTYNRFKTNLNENKTFVYVFGFRMSPEKWSNVFLSLKMENQKH